MIEVIPDMLECEGWFCVKVNGEVLMGKFNQYRRFRSEASAVKAAEKYIKETRALEHKD